MKLITTYGFLTAAFLWTAPSVQAASLNEWGAGAESFTLTCAGFSLPTCGVGTSPLDSGPSIDNYHASAADSDIVSAKGNAEAHARLSRTSGLSLPHLTAYAEGNTGPVGVAGIGEARAWILEGYQYNGAATTISLDAMLTGTVSNPAGSAFGTIRADIFIFDAADIEGYGSTDLSGCLGECFLPVDEFTLSLDESTSSATDFLTLSLSDGDQFYLWARLVAGAANGGISDALGTLTASFSNPSGLSAASVVPLPAAAWLFGCGLLGLVGVARRRIPD